MSYYEDASLVLIPSGYKNGKVYSQKPTDGAGDLTFTRASNATRVASNGLIEKVRTNLLLQSNTFSTTWTNTNSTETSGQAGYDGTNNAWLLQSTIASGEAYLRQTISTSGLKTFSIYAKAGTANFLAIYVNATTGTDPFAYFNLSTGAVGTTSATATASIVSVGSGWYRCSVAYNATIANIDVYVTTADNSFLSTTGNNIVIQASQLEDSDIATDYIATTTAAVSVGPVANVPRLDYLGSSCPRLLLEPQRTNLVFYSEQFDNAAWNKSASSVTANDGVSPDGYTNADLITSSGANGYVFPSNTNVLVSAAGATYTYSVYLKAGTASTITVLVAATATYRGIFDLSAVTATTNTANTTPSIVSVGNGWYRCAVVCTSVANTAYSELQIGRVASGLNFLAYGAQLEAGSYVSSYIPSLGAAVTRGADAFSLGSLQSNGIIGSTGLSFFMNFRKKNLASLAAKPSLASAGDLDVIGISTTATTLVSSVRIGGGSFTNTTILSPYNNEMVKVCFTLSGTTLKVFVNGSLALTTTASSSSVFTQLTTTTALDKDQEYEQILLFPTPLSDAEAIALTT